MVKLPQSVKTTNAKTVLVLRTHTWSDTNWLAIWRAYTRTPQWSHVKITASYYWHSAVTTTSMDLYSRWTTRIIHLGGSSNEWIHRAIQKVSSSPTKLSINGIKVWPFPLDCDIAVNTVWTILFTLWLIVLQHCNETDFSLKYSVKEQLLPDGIQYSMRDITVCQLQYG